MGRATVFAPGSIGTVAPGFDILGLAVDDIGDTVTPELIDGHDTIIPVRDHDASLVPTDPRQNVVSGAHGSGGSRGFEPARVLPIEGALDGEMPASGRHLDNIAPITMGGLVLSRIAQPIDVIKLPILDDWHIALVTPHVRVETKAARAILPMEWARGEWITQMANVAAMVHAFATGDGALLRRALDDRSAEPRRASLIPHFYEVKQAALDAGAFGCSISGSGPTVFAITSKDDVSRIAAAMQEAFDEVATNVHVAPIAQQGVRRV